MFRFTWFCCMKKAANLFSDSMLTSVETSSWTLVFGLAAAKAPASSPSPDMTVSLYEYNMKYYRKNDYDTYGTHNFKCHRGLQEPENQHILVTGLTLTTLYLGKSLNHNIHLSVSSFRGYLGAEIAKNIFF